MRKIYVMFVGEDTLTSWPLDDGGYGTSADSRIIHFNSNGHNVVISMYNVQYFEIRRV